MPSRASPSHTIKRKAVPTYLTQTSVPPLTDSRLLEENEIDALVEMYTSAAGDFEHGVHSESGSSSSSSPLSVCSHIEPPANCCGAGEGYHPSSSSDGVSQKQADNGWTVPDNAARAYLLLYSEPKSEHSGRCRRAVYGRRSWEHMLSEYAGTMESQDEQQFLSKMLARRRS